MSLKRNQQEDRRRKKQRSKETSFGTIPCPEKSTSCNLSSHPNLLSVTRGFGGENCFPPVTSSAVGTNNTTADGTGRGPENSSFCAIAYESEDDIMDLADKIFEDNHVFDESYSQALELDFHFHNVHLESLDEVFLSEMTSPLPVERNSEKRHNHHRLVEL